LLILQTAGYIVLGFLVGGFGTLIGAGGGFLLTPALLLLFPAMLPQIMPDYDRAHPFTEVTRDIFDRCKDLDYAAQMQYCDTQTWLRGDILVKGDRLSMAHALEVRVPFLDREVFEAARVLNRDDKFGGGTTKYAFRCAFKDMVNDATFMRPKLGYPVPVRKWLKNEMYDWARDIINNSGADKYIRRGEALRLLEDHRAGRADNYRPLWTLLVFMTWHKLYVERGGAGENSIAIEG